MVIVLNLFLIPKYSINGAAIATSISYFLILFLSMIKLKKLIRTKIPSLIWIKQFILAVLFVIVVIMVKSNLSVNIYLEIITSVLFASLIYFITTYLFGLINIKEIKYYLRILRK